MPDEGIGVLCGARCAVVGPGTIVGGGMGIKGPYRGRVLVDGVTVTKGKLWSTNANVVSWAPFPSDFPGGSFELLKNGIHTKLWPLPDSTIVYPGHGPVTTIGHEKRANQFV